MADDILALHQLANAAVGVLIVLVLGSLAARFCRQPVRRARLVLLTLFGGLAVPVLLALPVAPRWSAGLLPAPVPARASGVMDHSGATPGNTGRHSVAETRPVMSDTANEGPAVASRSRVQAAVPSRFTAVPWRRVVPGLYAAGAAALAAWWLFGQALLWRVTRVARPVPQGVRTHFLAVSGPAGARVRLLETDAITLPFTFTWTRPVIVLPASLCGGDDVAALRYCLAHEWSHVERRDAWAWNLAVLAGAVLFYQPLFWWLRRQLRLCQDYLADDRAAALGSPEDYAAYLVRLARARPSRSALPALGVGDRRSNLARRVAMLLQDRRPLERHCRTAWSCVVGVTAAAVIVAVSGFRLDAAAPGLPPPESTETKTKPKGSRTYVGRVTDKDSGKPIVGASVLVRLFLYRDPATGAQKTLEEIRRTTDSEGTYRFTISPEQIAAPSLGVYLDVVHPGYVRRYGAYGYGMIAKNEKLGSRPFFEDLQLRPGKVIEERLVSPEGAPVAGVNIVAFCADPPEKKDPSEFGAFTWTATDDDGRFRLDLYSSGPAVYWILPEHYALSTHVLKNDRRGDMGTIALEPGNTIQGKALDARGKPVAGVYVRADRDRTKDLEETPGFHSIGDHICRTVVTGDDGTFTIRALPAGTYRVSLVEQGWDPATRKDVEDQARRPLPGVFTAQRLTIQDGETADPLVIRGVPHVVVEAQIYDSKGSKARGHEVDLFGDMDGEDWSASVQPTEDGAYRFMAPHGLENARIDMSTNEHTVLRYRVSKDAPLSNAHSLRLGTLDHDIKGIQITRYVAPIVVVKVATGNGTKLADAAVSAHYTVKKKEGGGRRILKGGVLSDCGFETQEDGRFRSEQLFPDEEVTVTAQAKGYAPKSATFTLPEGTTREVELILDKE